MSIVTEAACYRLLMSERRFIIVIACDTRARVEILLSKINKTVIVLDPEIHYCVQGYIFPRADGSISRLAWCIPTLNNLTPLMGHMIKEADNSLCICHIDNEELRNRAITIAKTWAREVIVL